MTTKRISRMVWVCTLVMTLLTGAITAYAFSFGKYEKVKATGGVVMIPTAKVSDKAKFFKFDDGNREIAFFVVKAADGSIKTAFDACDACYKSKKGYEQQGDRMNCKNCNQKFAIGKLGPNATGGCNPGYLANQINGPNVTIKIEDLKAGARYF